MRFINQRLQDGHRIGHFVLRLAGGRERIGPRREELDPIRAMLDLLAHGCARVLHRTDHRAGQGIVRRGGVRGFGAPDDAEGRYLVPGPVDAALVDGVADGNIAVSIPVAAHVARCGETRS